MILPNTTNQPNVDLIFVQNNLKILIKIYLILSNTQVIYISSKQNYSIPSFK